MVTDADIEMFRKLRMLGMTKYRSGELEIEFGASVVLNPDDGVSRPMSEEEEEEVADRVLARAGKKRADDLFGAA